MKEKDYHAERGLPEAVMPACAVVKNLAGQKALVTGANSGIGKALMAKAGELLAEAPAIEKADVLGSKLPA